MSGQSFQVEPIAHVIGGRIEPTDDYWGGTHSIIRIDSTLFNADATAGLDELDSALAGGRGIVGCCAPW